MRSAAASVTDKACFLANIRSSPKAFFTLGESRDVNSLYGCTPLPFHLGLGLEPRCSGGQCVDGETNLCRCRKAAEADANPIIRIRLRKPEGAQHIRGLDTRRSAGRAGRDRDPRAGLDQLHRRYSRKAEIEVARQTAFGVAVEAEPRYAASETCLQA